MSRPRKRTAVLFEFVSLTMAFLVLFGLLVVRVEISDGNYVEHELTGIAKGVGQALEPDWSPHGSSEVTPEFDVYHLPKNAKVHVRGCELTVSAEIEGWETIHSDPTTQTDCVVKSAP